MNQILTLAWREVARLRRRFSGASSPLTVIVLLVTIGLSVFGLRNVTVLGGGLYRIGVWGDVPEISDARFAIVTVEPSQSQTLIDQHAIDVYINGAQVTSRNDDKSQNAIGALKKYLEKQELARIGTINESARAFPLRVGINYLDTNETATLESTTNKEVVIPSLTTPSMPFAQVIVALIFILPVTFISIFFTSSFMDEKINRRLTILLSTPITPFQIIIGKMLPYALFAMIAIAGIAFLTRGDVFLSLAIFIPTILFIFAIYLMVPLFYRTFQDVTFISMLVTTLTTAYLVLPAMFTGISDLAYMSPLTLAVKMFRAEPFGWREYLFPSFPMVAIFGLAVYAATRLLNEEFLMGYRPITRKLADALYLIMDRAHPYLSVALLSLCVIPIVYLAQLVLLAISTNLPVGYMLGAMLVAAALIEEIAKTMGIAVWINRGVVHSPKQIIALAFLSGLGFLAGEKLLLFFSISMVSETMLSGALFNTGLLLIPLVAHFVFSLTVAWLKQHKWRYIFALAVGTILHTIYNLALTGGFS